MHKKQDENNKMSQTEILNKQIDHTFTSFHVSVFGKFDDKPTTTIQHTTHKVYVVCIYVNSQYINIYINKNTYVCKHI